VASSGPLARLCHAFLVVVYSAMWFPVLSAEQFAVAVKRRYLLSIL